MAKDIGMTIRKGIVVPFLPCLVAFWGFHPYMFFHLLKCFFVTLLYKLLVDSTLYMETVIELINSIGFQEGSPHRL